MAVKSSFKNMTLCLFAICLVCSGLLAGVYALTKDLISAAEKAKDEAAIKEVLPPYAKIDTVKSTIPIGPDEYSYLLAYDENGNTIGCVVDVSVGGFGGPIVMKVGLKVNHLTAEVIIWNVKVLKHSETPGLGAKCTEPAFADQFREFDPAKKKLSVGKDIDAITASTITSSAYTKGVQTALNVCYAVMNQPKAIDDASGASCTGSWEKTDEAVTK